ncbi:hypothetical protein [Francisella tularensis]|uniref:hypothetical protein n=1 Tax=Francisella tularensis TaxID=263 RepID=UPI00174933A0|nr:hypothetical protein [Francisella tularensis]MBD5784543.1 hypothetical protein [Francisella tularensis subsp. holarctica]
MLKSGLPIPYGINVTTESSLKYYNDRQEISNEVKEQIFAHIIDFETRISKKFISENNTILVPGRSDTRLFMPGIVYTGSRR